MASSDDLEFSFLDLPETFGALTECGGNASLLASENEQNDFVGYIPVSAATSNVYPSPLIENSNTDQETLTRTSNFDQETAIVAHNQSFHQEDDYSKYFNTTENFNDISPSVFSNGQRENVYSGNCVLTSSNQMITTGQHGPLEQSYQQPLLSQTIPDFSNEPYVSTLVRSNIQEMDRANGPTNLNLIQHGLQDHHFHPSLYQEEQYNHTDLLLEQLVRMHETEHQMQLPKFSNMSTPISVGTLLNNQCLVPYASTPNTIPNPEYRTPMISNNLTLNNSGNYTPFTHRSYQPDSFAYAFQKSSSSNPTRRPRGRPRRFQSVMPSSLTITTPNNMSLVPATQTLLTPPRTYAQDKGKQHVTAMPSLNPTLYNHQYQNSYPNSMIQQSGGVRQRNCYNQFENEGSSSKIRRVMLPFQENSIADSSSVSLWQDGNMRSSAANHHEERLKNAVYDPFYAGVGLPIDPHLRFF
ncbi:hypothetical protein ISN44_As06g022180 [Arabidopsis suecica]|uniref:Uncharacterized protein n=1 Tax=Arabidopsis suecica TaxID=45249 RepID=A0A8T2CC77_ARASU|nr:hypothetical protein ISN44_As06g022180 [Arabidopsis suecica]